MVYKEGLMLYTTLATILSKAHKLEDLDLTAVHTGSGFDERGAGIASIIFGGLSNHTHLRRLSLCEWTIDDEEGRFVDFLALHANTLRYLLLNRIYLIGSWRNVLKTIAPMMSETLQLLRLWSFHEQDWQGEYDPRITDADFAMFECQVSWSYGGIDEPFDKWLVFRRLCGLGEEA
jgi:hypothetical protein